MTEEVAPDVIVELRGMAEGSGVPFESLFVLNAGAELAQTLGRFECTVERPRLRRLYRFLQCAVVMLRGLMPMVILWASADGGEGTRWLGVNRPWALVQALPAALASMLAAIMSSYRWREEWSRFEFTAEAVKSEWMEFETRMTDDYSGDEAALNTFVTKIEALAATEVTGW
jgi:hypothetical protein